MLALNAYFKNAGNIPADVLNTVSSYIAKKCNVNLVIDCPKLPDKVAQQITEKLITAEGGKLKPSMQLKQYVENQVDMYLESIINKGLLTKKDVAILKPEMTKTTYYQRNNSSENKVKMVHKIMSKYLESREISLK